MEYNKLGKSNISVSKVCLGTMNYGEQNSQEEAFEQMDYAFENGVNFIDTAEMYSVPGRKETQGSTETIIGNWLHARKNRDQLIIATKAVGNGVKYIRNGPDFSNQQLKDAVNGSLKRLQTDYIDLYQLHWPDRENNRFGTRLYPYEKNIGYKDNFLEVIQTIDELIKEGKIKHWGLSNESPWGVMKYLELCRKHNIQEPITIQNAYGLLNRQYEYGLSEISQFEGIGLLAYSPLAFGALTGKYLDGKKPEGARLSLFSIFNRFLNKRAMKATQAFKDLAEKNNLTVTQLGLAFVYHQPFVNSTIIGATKMNQLKENIDAVNIKLSKELIKDTNRIFEDYPDAGL